MRHTATREDDAIYTFLDTETTGLDMRAQVVEVAYVQTDAAFQVVREFESLVHYIDEIPEAAAKVNNISLSMTLKSPKFYEIWPQIALDLDGTILVGHNVEFDIRMLAQTFNASEYHVEYELMPGRSINTQLLVQGASLIRALATRNIFREGEPHTAISDAKACRALLARCIEVNSEILNKWWWQKASPCSVTKYQYTRSMYAEKG